MSASRTQNFQSRTTTYPNPTDASRPQQSMTPTLQTKTGNAPAWVLTARACEQACEQARPVEPTSCRCLPSCLRETRTLYINKRKKEGRVRREEFLNVTFDVILASKYRRRQIKPPKPLGPAPAESEGPTNHIVGFSRSGSVTPITFSVLRSFISRWTPYLV
jgi:hypothetical protein